jgi:hypothetical protein
LHLNKYEFTKPAPETVTILPPDMSPDEGTTEDRTALKLKGVVGTIAGFPRMEPLGAAGQQLVLEG